MIKVECRVLGYAEREYEGKTYGDFTVRVDGKVMKVATIKASKDFNSFVDKDVTLSCEASPAYRSSLLQLKVVSVS